MNAKARIGLITMLAAVAALQCAQAHDGPGAKRTCDVSMLHGLYLFKGTGYASLNGETKPKAVLGTVRFNGDGTASTETLNLTIAGLPPMTHNGDPGTYTVEPDCTGTVSFAPNGPTWAIIVVSSKFFSQIQTGGPDHGTFQGDNWFISR
ncbi:MAG: hypothetical protein ACJ8OJ_17200 [Povalibacter sp.]